MLLMNKENCALKLVDEIILYYDARSKKTSKKSFFLFVRLGSVISTLQWVNPCCLSFSSEAVIFCCLSKDYDTGLLIIPI